MPTIKFTGPALVDSGQENDDGTISVISDVEVLKSLDGLRYEDEEFSDYLADDESTSLIAEYVSGGILIFEYAKESEALVGSIEYQLSRPLVSGEIEMLKEYTIEQLLDGIGSNFSQERVLNGDAAPFINYQELAVDQVS